MDCKNSRNSEYIWGYRKEMLIEFTVGNYLSFKDRKTLSMEAATVKEHAETNVSIQGRFELLKGAVLYGANASGKSNLLAAMSTMRRLVSQSLKASSEDTLNITPFLLHNETAFQPSFFEVLILVNDVRYRYGFEVDNESVRSEWLFVSKKKVEKPLFIRTEEGIEVTSAFSEARDLEDKTRENALFLAVVDQFNGPIAKEIMRWFANLKTISGLADRNYKSLTYQLLESEKTKAQLVDFYQKLDLGFNEIELEKEPFDHAIINRAFSEELLKELAPHLGVEKTEIKTLHTVYDSQNQAVGMQKFAMQTQESSGTNKVFNISGALFSVLNKGGVLVIDELDASLHPLMTLTITKLFNSMEYNPHNAQLIIATHDTNLLEYGNFRRDQIYFVEKNNFGASDIYSLVEYIEDGGQKVRKDRSFEKDYIQGRYGAIPFIGNMDNIIA